MERRSGKSCMQTENELYEKEIPMKPRITISTIRCGRCNTQLTNRGCIKENYNYCKICGQRIDWKPVKEDRRRNDKG